MKGTKDITDSDRIMKEQSENKFRFTIKKTVPRDSGTYWLVARNELGTDRACVTITVGMTNIDILVEMLIVFVLISGTSEAQSRKG